MASIKDIASKFNKEYKDNNLAIISNIRPEYKRLASGALGAAAVRGAGKGLQSVGQSMQN